MKFLHLKERWSEVTRRIQMWVEIRELNDQGNYCPVDVHQAPEIVAGGCYQLKQVGKVTMKNDEKYQFEVMSIH